MMVLALALLQAGAEPQATSPEQDVVVIGRRLAAWRGKVSTTFGITTCKTTRSTGDREIDDVGCTALKRCWSQYRPQITAARKQHTETENPNAQRIYDEAGKCLKSTRDELVDRLVAHRHDRSS